MIKKEERAKSTLRKYTKEELVERLKLWQRNYDQMKKRYLHMNMQLFNLLDALEEDGTRIRHFDDNNPNAGAMLDLTDYKKTTNKIILFKRDKQNER